MSLCKNVKKIASVQIEGSRNPKNNERKFEKNTCTKKIFWKPNSRNALCWVFYCVNDNKKIDLTTLQVIYCILCYNS